MKILSVILCLFLATATAKAGTEYEGQWPELGRRSQDTISGLKCLTWLPSQSGVCYPRGSRGAHCDISFFGGRLPYEVQGGGTGDYWNGYITMNGTAIGIMSYNTRFSPYRASDWSLVLQRFTYTMLDGTVASCEIRQYSKAFWAFLDLN